MCRVLSCAALAFWATALAVTMSCVAPTCVAEHEASGPGHDSVISFGRYMTHPAAFLFLTGTQRNATVGPGSRLDEEAGTVTIKQLSRTGALQRVDERTGGPLRLPRGRAAGWSVWVLISLFCHFGKHVFRPTGRNSGYRPDRPYDCVLYMGCARAEFSCTRAQDDRRGITHTRAHLDCHLEVSARRCRSCRSLPLVSCPGRAMTVVDSHGGGTERRAADHRDSTWKTSSLTSGTRRSGR